MASRICKCGARMVIVNRDKKEYYRCTGCGREGARLPAASAEKKAGAKDE